MVRYVFIASTLLCVVGLACSRGGTNSTSAVPIAAPVPTTPPHQGHCLNDAQVSSNVTQPEPDLVVIDWSINVANSCPAPHDIRATYQAWGANNELVQSDSQDLSIEASSRATASGLMRLTAAEWERVTHRSGFAQFR
jgi:hypothetical protein